MNGYSKFHKLNLEKCLTSTPFKLRIRLEVIPVLNLGQEDISVIDLRQEDIYIIDLRQEDISFLDLRQEDFFFMNRHQNQKKDTRKEVLFNFSYWFILNIFF